MATIIPPSTVWFRVLPSATPRSNHLTISMLFDAYTTDGFHDEMFESDGIPRACARLLFERIRSVGDEEVRRYQHAAEQALLRMGITFNVYGDEAGTEKILPFDIIPRIVPADEWIQIDRGLRQRTHALNLFIDDI